jgi:hypothetical protein
MPHAKESAEEKFKAAKSDKQGREIQQMQKSGFPIRTGPKHREAEGKQPGKKGAPISIYSVFHIPAQIRARDV